MLSKVRLITAPGLYPKAVIYLTSADIKHNSMV